MKVVKLLPMNKRLKQVVTMHGSEWIVLEDRPVACFDGARGLFIEAMRGSHQRWVRPEHVEVK